MKRFIAAAFTLIGLVFTVGCVGAPESEGAGGNSGDESINMSESDPAPALSTEAFVIKCPPDSCGYRCVKVNEHFTTCRCSYGDDCVF